MIDSWTQARFCLEYFELNALSLSRSGTSNSENMVSSCDPRRSFALAVR